MNQRTGIQTLMARTQPGQFGGWNGSTNLLGLAPAQTAAVLPQGQNVVAIPLQANAPQQVPTPEMQAQMQTAGVPESEQQQQQIADAVKSAEDINNAPALNEFQQKLLELRGRMRGPNATIKTDKDKEYDRLGKLLGKRMGGD